MYQTFLNIILSSCHYSLCMYVCYVYSNKDQSINKFYCWIAASRKCQTRYKKTIVDIFAADFFSVIMHFRFEIQWIHVTLILTSEVSFRKRVSKLYARGRTFSPNLKFLWPFVLDLRIGTGLRQKDRRGQLHSVMRPYNENRVIISEYYCKPKNLAVVIDKHERRLQQLTLK